MSDVQLDQNKAIEEARNNGFKVYRGNPKLLLLDLDGNDSVLYFEGNMKLAQDLFAGLFSLKEKKRWVSKSKGIHILLRINRPLSLLERLLLQAVLGSDLKKELYSLARYWQGTSEPSLLFRPPEKKKMLPKFKLVKTKGISTAEPLGGFQGAAGNDDDDVPF